MEELENKLLENPSQSTLLEIYRLKCEIILVRISAWPLREVMNQMMRVEDKIIKLVLGIPDRYPFHGGCDVSLIFFFKKKRWI